MAVAQPLILRCGFCALCGEIFFVCRCCERGQRYCSKLCSMKVRREKCREYEREYQQSKDGRLHHASRQEKYRQRKSITQAVKKVTDHSLVQRFFSGKVKLNRRDGFNDMDRCSFCGRAGVVMPSIEP
jgi:hypothetical protein